MVNYIYGLYCPLAASIRYIGKSVEPPKRFGAHLRSAKNFDYNHHTARWLRTLIDAGLEPRLVFLEEVPANESWQEAERTWILCAEDMGWELTNSTAGGEGLDYRNPEDEARYRANLSAAMKRRFATSKGREQILAMGVKARSDPLMLARRVAGMRKAYEDPAYKARNLEVLAEIGSRPEVKAKKAAYAKENFYGGPLHQTLLSPEFKADQAERLSKRWTESEHRNKMQKARWTPEARAAQASRIHCGEHAQKMQKALSDPEMLKRRNAAIKKSWIKRRADKAAKMEMQNERHD